MSKDRDRKIARAREAKLEANFEKADRERQAMATLAWNAADERDRLWSQAWLLMWATIDATIVANDCAELAHVFLDRLKLAADGATCAFCVAVGADEAKQAAFREHVRGCERHPAYQMRMALEHARHELVTSGAFRPEVMAVIDAALGPPPGPVMQPIAAAEVA